MEKRLMTVVAAIAVSTSMAFAQTSISGTVISNDDEEPIIGASIRIDGTKTGTVTDINGNFSLIVPNKNSSLVISYLGMKTVTVKAVNGMKVVLLSDSKNLDDVVVTAQGLKRQKRSLGYATQEIKSADLTSVGQQGLNNALAGKVAGARFVGGSGAKFDEGCAPWYNLSVIRQWNSCWSCSRFKSYLCSRWRYHRGCRCQHE